MHHLLQVCPFCSTVSYVDDIIPGISGRKCMISVFTAEIRPAYKKSPRSQRRRGSLRILHSCPAAVASVKNFLPGRVTSFVQLHILMPGDCA